jgi:hypothetical protein
MITGNSARQSKSEHGKPDSAVALNCTEAITMGGIWCVWNRTHAYLVEDKAKVSSKAY